MDASTFTQRIFWGYSDVCVVLSGVFWLNFIRESSYRVFFNNHKSVLDNSDFVTRAVSELSKVMLPSVEEISDPSDISIVSHLVVISNWMANFA